MQTQAALKRNNHIGSWEIEKNIALKKGASK